MGFITEQMVSDPLAYLAIEPHPVAIAKGKLTRCENAKRTFRSKAFLTAQGSVAERQATSDCDRDYLTACDAEAESVQEYENARAKINWANTTIDVWRSQEATIRASEKIR